MAKILNPKPEPAVNGEKPSEEGFSLISNEKLLAIYTAMVKCRMLEQRATTLFQQGRLKSDLHASAKREAAVAAVIDLLPEDTLCIAPGDWLPALVKGMSLEGIFRVLAPAESQPDGVADFELRQKNILVPSSDAIHTKIVRERASEALIQKKGAIVLAFTSSGSESREHWQKAMVSAATRKLPIVFVHYLDPPPQPVKTGVKPDNRNPGALLHGVPAIAVDALDPVAVYRVAFEAITRARQARGATLLQCTVHPILPANSSSANGRQPASETASPDPVIAMERYLKEKAIQPEPHNRNIVDAFSRDLDIATRFLDR